MKERQAKETHVEKPVSLIVHLVRWPPSLHPLPLEEVVSGHLCVSSGQLVKTALVCLICRQGHGTQVEVHSAWEGGGRGTVTLARLEARARAASPMKSSGLKRSLSQI